MQRQRDKSWHCLLAARQQNKTARVTKRKQKRSTSIAEISRVGGYYTVQDYSRSFRFVNNIHLHPIS